MEKNHSLMCEKERRWTGVFKDVGFRKEKAMSRKKKKLSNLIRGKIFSVRAGSQRRRRAHLDREEGQRSTKSKGQLYVGWTKKKMLMAVNRREKKEKSRRRAFSIKKYAKRLRILTRRRKKTRRASLFGGKEKKAGNDHGRPTASTKRGSLFRQRTMRERKMKKRKESTACR